MQASYRKIKRSPPEDTGSSSPVYARATSNTPSGLCRPGEKSRPERQRGARRAVRPFFRPILLPPSRPLGGSRLSETLKGIDHGIVLFRSGAGVVSSQNQTMEEKAAELFVSPKRTQATDLAECPWIKRHCRESTHRRGGGSAFKD